MNEQAEEILLGSILIDNSILDEITLLPEHFMNLMHQNLYKSMLSIKKKNYPIDVASLKDDLGEDGFFFMGGEERIRAYKEIVPSIHAFKSYEKFILNQWKINTTKELIRPFLDKDARIEDVKELIDSLNKIDEKGTSQRFNLKEHLAKMYDLVTVPTPKERSGVPSGFKDLDDKTDGFQPNDLVIVGARPSMGKTALLLNMSLNAFLKAQAIPVIFSLEMSAESLIKRMLSRIAIVNGMKLKNPYHYMLEDEKDRWIKGLGVIEKMQPFIFDESRQSIADMRANVRQIKHSFPDKKMIIFIDYLTLIKPSQNYKGNMHGQISEISADLKAMAKDFNCPVVCLAQLSRGVESRDDKRPRMSDLRESGSIEQDADIIMMLYRAEYYDKENTAEEDKNVLEVDVAKNRDGETGRIKLKYIKEINKIETLKR